MSAPVFVPVLMTKDGRTQVVYSQADVVDRQWSGWVVVGPYDDPQRTTEERLTALEALFEGGVPDPGTGTGLPGKSTYQLWLDAGNTGTFDDFLAAQRGPKGDSGDITGVPAAAQGTALGYKFEPGGGLIRNWLKLPLDSELFKLRGDGVIDPRVKDMADAATQASRVARLGVGLHRFDGLLKLENGSGFDGEGKSSVLELGGDTASIQIGQDSLVTDGPMPGGRLTNLKIDGKQRQNGGRALDIRYIGKGRFDGLELINCYGPHAMRLMGTQNSSFISFRMERVGRDALLFDAGCGGNTFFDFRIGRVGMLGQGGAMIVGQQTEASNGYATGPSQNMFIAGYIEFQQLGQTEFVRLSSTTQWQFLNTRFALGTGVVSTRPPSVGLIRVGGGLATDTLRISSCTFSGDADVANRDLLVFYMEDDYLGTIFLEGLCSFRGFRSIARINSTGTFDAQAANLRLLSMAGRYEGPGNPNKVIERHGNIEPISSWAPDGVGPLVGTMPFDVPAGTWIYESLVTGIPAPLASTVTVDVNKNGATIFTDQSKRNKINAGQTTHAGFTLPAPPTFVGGDRITFDIDSRTASTPVQMTLRLRRLY